MTNDFGGDNAERMCAAKPPTLPHTPNLTERHSERRVCCANREYLKQMWTLMLHFEPFVQPRNA